MPGSRPASLLRRCSFRPPRTGIGGGEVKGDVIVEGYLVPDNVVPTSEQMAPNNCTGC